MSRPTRSSAIRASAIGTGSPTRTDIHAGGSPARWKARTSSIAVSGALSAGLSTTPHPAATAGPILCAASVSGKLNGVIAATTPTGTRIVKPRCPAPAGCASSGIPRPANDRASTAEKISVCTQRSASPSACFIGLPFSAEIIAANSSRRACTSMATRSRISARSAAVSPACIASQAPSTAGPTASASSQGTAPTVRPSHGEVTSTVEPPATSSPATTRDVTDGACCIPWTPCRVAGRPADGSIRIPAVERAFHPVK